MSIYMHLTNRTVNIETADEDEEEGDTGDEDAGEKDETPYLLLSDKIDLVIDGFS
jgi:hypothetical protein